MTHVVILTQLSCVCQLSELIQDKKINELKSLISQRKLKYANLKNTLIVDPRLYRTEKGKNGALLVRTPGSPGVVEGKVFSIDE